MKMKNKKYVYKNIKSGEYLTFGGDPENIEDALKLTESDISPLRKLISYGHPVRGEYRMLNYNQEIRKNKLIRIDYNQNENNRCESW